MMKPVVVSALVTIMALSVTGCGDASPQTVAEQAPLVTNEAPVPFDHHVHLLSPTLLADWKSLGVPFSKPDSAYLSAENVLGSSDRPAAAGPAVSGAFLVSMAHFYGNPEFRGALGLSVAEEQERVRGENEHVAAEAARYGDHALAFCSVPVLRPYADEELDYCFETLRVRGLKVHAASSELDLRRDDHLDRLAALFGEARREERIVLLHLDPQMRGHEKEHIREFIARVLAPRPDLQIVIAHLGGSGGYGAWTADVLGTFIEWIEEHETNEEPLPGLRFDLSGVILERESEGVPATTDEEAARLAVALRRLGLERVVLGSDYPVFQSREVVTSLETRLRLRPEELRQILANRIELPEAAGR